MSHFFLTSSSALFFTFYHRFGSFFRVYCIFTFHKVIESQIDGNLPKFSPFTSILVLVVFPAYFCFLSFFFVIYSFLLFILNYRSLLFFKQFPHISLLSFYIFYGRLLTINVFFPIIILSQKMHLFEAVLDDMSTIFSE